MLTVRVCMMFGWDYHTYMAQPAWFIDLIEEKIIIDAKKESQASKGTGARASAR